MKINQELQQIIKEFSEGNQDEARKSIRGYIRREPKDEFGWWIYAKMTRDTGERIRCLERVLDLNPENREAQSKLSEMKAVMDQTLIEKVIQEPNLNIEEPDYQKIKPCIHCGNEIPITENVCELCGDSQFQSERTMDKWEYMKCFYFTNEEDVKEEGKRRSSKKSIAYLRTPDEKLYRAESVDTMLDYYGREGWELVSTTPIIGQTPVYSGIGGVAVALTAGPVAQTRATETQGIVLWFKRNI